MNIILKRGGLHGAMKKDIVFRSILFSYIVVLFAYVVMIMLILLFRIELVKVFECIILFFSINVIGIVFVLISFVHVKNSNNALHM